MYVLSVKSIGNCVDHNKQLKDMLQKSSGAASLRLSYATEWLGLLGEGLRWCGYRAYPESKVWKYSRKRSFASLKNTNYSARSAIPWQHFAKTPTNHSTFCVKCKGTPRNVSSTQTRSLQAPFVVSTLISPHTNKNQEEPKETFNKERARQALASASMTEKGLSNSKTHSFHSLPLLRL